MKLRSVALWIFGASLLFQVARVPHATWNKRLGQVRLFGELDTIGYHIGRTWPKLAADARWIRAHTPEDAVILWRGHWKGPIELLVAAIGQRLLYSEARWKGTSEVLGRPVAHGARGRASGTLVIVANGDEVALEFLP